MTNEQCRAAPRRRSLQARLGHIVESEIQHLNVMWLSRYLDHRLSPSQPEDAAFGEVRIMRAMVDTTFARSLREPPGSVSPCSTQ